MSAPEKKGQARQWLDVTRLEVKETQLYDEDKWMNGRMRECAGAAAHR